LRHYHAHGVNEAEIIISRGVIWLVVKGDGDKYTEITHRKNVSI